MILAHHEWWIALPIILSLLPGAIQMLRGKRGDH